MNLIDCFLQTEQSLELFKAQDEAGSVKLITPGDLLDTEALRALAGSVNAPYTLICVKPTDIRLVNYSLGRMLQVMRDNSAVLVYSDHFYMDEHSQTEAPVIDCQEGALRDDFDFGALLLVDSAALKEAVAGMDSRYRFAALYDLRLRLSRLGPLVHINEYLYYEVELDKRSSGEKQFDYVNPRNREVQIEMEQACTAHLKAVGAWLPPVFKEIDPGEGEFKYEASVVIPCRNRAGTIGDAIRSALGQKTDFPYNVIVVDDNSTDGTPEIIRPFAAQDPRLIYIAQDKSWHEIGRAHV